MGMFKQEFRWELCIIIGNYRDEISTKMSDFKIGKNDSYSLATLILKDSSEYMWIR